MQWSAWVSPSNFRRFDVCQGILGFDDLNHLHGWDGWAAHAGLWREQGKTLQNAVCHADRTTASVVQRCTQRNETAESAPKGEGLPAPPSIDLFFRALFGIRRSVGTENPIPEEMDHCVVAVRVPVMNEVQFLFPSEPCKPLKS